MLKNHMIEIRPIKKINKSISVPGSKYIANRVLIIAALAEGVSEIKNLPENEDIKYSIATLKQLGVKIEKKSDVLIIYGTGGNFQPVNRKIDVGESGTLMRFITGVSCLIDGDLEISGCKRMEERPIGELLRSLSELGVSGEALNNDCPPIIMHGGNFTGGKTRISGNISSQFLSSLLIISCYAQNDVEIIVKSKLVSRKYIDLTLELMEEFGISVEREAYKKFTIKSGRSYKARNYTISGDWSSANYFFAAAALTKGYIKINDLDIESNHGEAKFVDVLDKMGCEVKKESGSVVLRNTGKLNGIEVDMSEMPDAVQTLAVVGAFAEGATGIKDIEHLKYKECDRINDTINELQKVGVTVEQTQEGMIIKESNLNHQIIDSHGDHRMAMSFALMGLIIPGIRISNPDCVKKSFPGFWKKLEEIGVSLSYV